MQSPGERQRHVQNFIISLIAHILVFILIIAIPMCSFRRFRKPEHKIYTFDLINPALISMKKTSGSPLGAGKTKGIPQAIKKEEIKKEAPKKEPEKQKEPVKKEKAKEQPKKSEKSKKPDKNKMGLKESEESKATKKLTIEDKIAAQLKKIEEKGAKEWIEADDEAKLKKLGARAQDGAEKGDLLATGEGFTNVNYNDVVQSKIYENWQTPSKNLAKKEGLTVSIGFIISRDGKVTALKIIKSSGNEVLDNSALQAIRDAEPLPPLPDDYKGESLEAGILFVPEE